MLFVWLSFAPPAPKATIDQAAWVAGGGEGCSVWMSCAQRPGLTGRTLERTFLDLAGVSPRLNLRLVRFRYAAREERELAGWFSAAEGAEIVNIRAYSLKEPPL
jgi:hypothetical protein